MALNLEIASTDPLLPTTHRHYRSTMNKAKESFMRASGPIEEEEMKLEDLIKKSESANLKWPSCRYWVPEIIADWRLSLNCIIGGLIVAFVTVPSSMAYCLMVDFPVKYGVNSCTIPLIIYALFGSSKQMSIGPLATSYFILGQAVDFVRIGDEDRAELARTMTFLIGCFLVLMGSLQLSFIENVFSEPIMFGYLQATAFLIVYEQFAKIFQIKFHGAIWNKFYQLFDQIGIINIYSTILGFSMIILLFANQYIKNKYGPKSLFLCTTQLIFIFSFTFVSHAFDFPGTLGIYTAQEVPTGFPPFEAPNLSLAYLNRCWPDSLKIALVSFTASLLITKQLGRKHQYEINTTFEFFGLGFANLSAAFFTSLPAFGSLCRSPIIELTNAKSQLAGFLTGIFVIIEVIGLSWVLEMIPISVISGYVFFSCSLIFSDLKEVYFWFKYFKSDFYFFVVSFFLCMILGLANGLIVSIIISLLLILKESSRPIWSFKSFEADEEKLEFENTKITGLVRRNTKMLIEALDPEAQNLDANTQKTWLDHLKKLTNNNILRRLSQMNNVNEEITEDLMNAYDVCLCHNWQCQRRCHLVVVTLHGYLSYVNVKTLKEHAEFMTADAEGGAPTSDKHNPRASMKRSFLRTDESASDLKKKKENKEDLKTNNLNLDDDQSPYINEHFMNIQNEAENSEDPSEDDEKIAKNYYDSNQIAVTPETRKLSIRAIIFECTRLTKVDCTSLMALKGLINDLYKKENKTWIKFSEMKPEIIEKFKVMKFPESCMDQSRSNTMAVLFKCCSDILRYEAMKKK